MEQISLGIDLSERCHIAERMAATPGTFFFLGLALLICLGPIPSFHRITSLQIEQWVAAEGVEK